METVSGFLELLKRDGGFSPERPTLASGIPYLVVFIIFMCFHTVISIRTHQWWFFGSWGMGLALEIVSYAGRIWNYINESSESAYIMQLVCVTIAPCFLMAGMYYILAQLVLIYGDEFSYLKPKLYSIVFISCDLVAVILQGAGGGSASSPDGSQVDRGLHIMTAGLAFQVFIICVFQYLWYRFLWKVYQKYKSCGDAEFNPNFVELRQRKTLIPFYIACSITVILIFIRSIYRLVEISLGWDSSVAKDEIYAMLLDGMLIALSSVLMIVFHPGLAYGKNAHLYMKSHFPKDHDDVKFVDESNDNFEMDYDIRKQL